MLPRLAALGFQGELLGDTVHHGDGGSTLLVREARPGEISAWEASFARACTGGDADEADRDDWATFLVEVVDPTGGADEGDGDKSG